MQCISNEVNKNAGVDSNNPYTDTNQTGRTLLTSFMIIIKS